MRLISGSGGSNSGRIRVFASRISCIRQDTSFFLQMFLYCTINEHKHLNPKVRAFFEVFFRVIERLYNSTSLGMYRASRRAAGFFISSLQRRFVFELVHKRFFVFVDDKMFQILQVD